MRVPREVIEAISALLDEEGFVEEACRLDEIIQELILS